MSIVQVEKFQQEPKVGTGFVKIRKHGEGSGGINQKWMEVPCKLKRWRLSCKDTETSMTHTALMQWLLQFTAWDEYTMTSKAVQWPRNWSTIPWQPQVSDQLANGFWKSLTVGGKDAYDGAGKICLVSSWHLPRKLQATAAICSRPNQSQLVQDWKPCTIFAIYFTLQKPEISSNHLPTRWRINSFPFLRLIHWSISRPVWLRPTVLNIKKQQVCQVSLDL